MTSLIQNILSIAPAILLPLLLSTGFLLVLFIGFCIMLGFPKLRPTRKTSMVHRSLDEMVGDEQYAKYLPPNAPRGPADQLRTPELLEAAERRS